MTNSERFIQAHKTAKQTRSCFSTYRDLSEAITLTRWLRNIDLAREVALWKTCKDFGEPPKLSDDYVDSILLPGLFGAKR